MTLGPSIAFTRLGGTAVWVVFLQTGVVGFLLGALLADRLRPGGRS
ncbi:hypothetical protein SANTM175S_07184 [Streptomyces antimycoticus]